MLKDFFKGLEMATRDKKTQVRIDPAISKAISVVAKSSGVPAYEMLELICCDWIIKNRPDLVVLINEVVDMNSAKKDKD